MTRSNLKTVLFVTLFTWLCVFLPPLNAQRYGGIQKHKVVSDVPPVIVRAEDFELGDPIENVNRKIYAFNEVFDEYLLAPIARGYRAVVSPYARDRVGDAMSNLKSPIYFANNLLQGNVRGTLTSFWRFVLNTTFGIGGLFDFASEAGLEAMEEDFGQTLAIYGVGNGPYLVLPFLGPTNARDLVGRVADGFANPVNYATPAVTLGVQATDVIDTREGFLDVMDDIYRTSFDPYVTIRSGYFQNRNNAIRH